LIKSILSLHIYAGLASSKAPLGPTLGQYGIPISDFCTMFNTLTESYNSGLLLHVSVFLYADLGYEIFVEGVYIVSLLKKNFLN